MPRKTKKPTQPTKGMLVLTEREQKRLDKLLSTDYSKFDGHWNGMRRVSGDAKPGDVVRNRQKTYRVIIPQAGGNMAMVQDLDTNEVSEINIGHFTYTVSRITIELQSFRMRVQARRASEIHMDFQQRLSLDPTVDNYHLLVSEYWDELQMLRIDGSEPDMHTRKILVNAIKVIQDRHNTEYPTRRTVGGFSLMVRSHEPGKETSYQGTITLPPEASGWDRWTVSQWVAQELMTNRGLSQDTVSSLDFVIRKAFGEQSGCYLTTFSPDRRHLLETEAVVIPTDWELMIDTMIEDKEPMAIIDGWL